MRCTSETVESRIEFVINQIAEARACGGTLGEMALGSAQSYEDIGCFFAPSDSVEVASDPVGGSGMEEIPYIHSQYYIGADVVESV